MYVNLSRNTILYASDSIPGLNPARQAPNSFQIVHLLFPRKLGSPFHTRPSLLLSGVLSESHLAAGTAIDVMLESCSLQAQVLWYLFDICAW